MFLYLVCGAFHLEDKRCAWIKIYESIYRKCCIKEGQEGREDIYRGRAGRGIEGTARGEENGVSEGKNEWRLWKVGCEGEVYEWRTEVTEIEYRQQRDASAGGKWKR